MSAFFLGIKKQNYALSDLSVIVIRFFFFLYLYETVYIYIYVINFNLIDDQCFFCCKSAVPSNILEK